MDVLVFRLPSQNLFSCRRLDIFSELLCISCSRKVTMSFSWQRLLSFEEVWYAVVLFLLSRLFLVGIGLIFQVRYVRRKCWSVFVFYFFIACCVKLLFSGFFSFPYISFLFYLDYIVGSYTSFVCRQFPFRGIQVLLYCYKCSLCVCSVL